MRTRRARSEQSGFTLIEIAIVMVIIGLLVGGVLKGQAMIDNAKTKRVAKQADELRAAVMTFYDKYGQYPGDENIATVPPGGGDSNGDGNGQIAGTEPFEVYRDLALGGLISGTYNGTSSLPQHAFGGNVDLIWIDPPGASTPAAHYFRFLNLPADVASELDLKMDNGAYDTGSVVGSAAYTPGSRLATLYIRF